MKPVQFLSNSPQIEKIIKGLTLTKSLIVTSILIGEPYTGKKSLVESLFPKAVYIDGAQRDILIQALHRYDEIIIYNFDQVTNLSALDFTDKRIIAISDQHKSSSEIEEKFAFIYTMPSLQERPEDIKLLSKYFCTKIQEELIITSDCYIDQTQLDLSENIKSLKASIYRQLVTADLNQEELEQLIYTYLYPKLEGNNAYREHIQLFERPLIRAGLTKFRSQLKLSTILGLNRNTLRKKIHEHHLDWL